MATEHFNAVTLIAEEFTTGDSVAAEGRDRVAVHIRSERQRTSVHRQPVPAVVCD